MSTVLKSSLLNLAATGVSLAAGFGVSFIVARLLGPEGSGLSAFAIWLATSLSALSDHGMPQTMLRSLGVFGDDEDGWKALARTAFARFIRAVALSASAVLAYAVWVASTEGLDKAAYWVSATLLFVLYALYAFTTAAARGRGRFAEASLATATGSLLQIPLLMAGAMFFGIAGAVAAIAMRYLPQVLKLPTYLSRTHKPDPALLTPDIRRYARHIWLSDIIDVVIMTRVELVLLGIMLTPADMGYFAVAGVFASLVGQFAIQLSSPLIVGFAAPDQSPQARDALYRKAVRIMALVVFPVGFGGAAIAPQLVPLVFGADFAPASLAAFLLLVAAGFSGVVVVPWAYLAATGKSGNLLRIMIVVSAATLVLFVASILIGGVEGAAVTRVLVELLSLNMLFLAIVRSGGPSAPYRALVKTVLAAASCGLAAWLVMKGLGGWSGILAGVAAGALIYLVALRLLRLVPQSDTAPLLESGAMARLPSGPRKVLTALLKAIAVPVGN